LRGETRSPPCGDNAFELRQLAKIEKKTHFKPGGAEIIQDLSRVGHCERAPGLHLHYHLSGDNQIGSILSDRMTVKPNLKRHLAFDSQARGTQCHRQCILVYALEEAVAQFSVDGIERGQDRIRNTAMQ
jgi:hypothetical protein